MRLILTLIITVVLSVLLRTPIRKAPWVFYALAIIVDVIFLTQALAGVAPVASRVIDPYVGRCLVGFALFALVMFLGVFPTENKFRKMMMPIRGELSVIGCLLVFGHVINYLGSYLRTLAGGFSGMRVTLAIGLVVAFVLLAMLIPLTVTSFRNVKARMNAASWKRLQKWAYPFFGLIYAHIVLVLGPSAIAGGKEAIVSLICYTVVFVAYTALRVARALASRKSN